MLNEKIRGLLKAPLWYIGTFSDQPNTVPVKFHSVEPDGVLTIADVFLDKTLLNIYDNGKISVSVCDMETLEGCQIKGTAHYITEGAIVDEYKAKVEEFFKGKKTCKGVVIITPKIVYITTPNDENNEDIYVKH